MSNRLRLIGEPGLIGVGTKPGSPAGGGVAKAGPETVAEAGEPTAASCGFASAICAKAWRNSSAVWKRSAGFLAMDFMIRSLSAFGMVGTISMGWRGVSFTCACMIEKLL